MENILINNEIELILNNALKKCEIESKLSVSFSNLPSVCDFQCNGCFSLVKTLKKSPKEIAELIINNIEKTDDFDFSELNGFINISLTDKKLSSLANLFLKDDMAGVDKHEKKERVILDYGGANVAKALHVGHLRSPIIGESLKRLYKFFGDEVISDVHLGDWGLQMGLTELGLYYDGKLDYYFKGQGNEPEITLDMLNEAYPKASARKNEDAEFKKQADEWTLKIQNKEEPYYQIYKKIREVSVEKIKQNYQELNATFDLWNGESSAEDYIEKTLKIISDKGLSRESEGAIVVDVALENENIPIPKKSPDEVQRYKNPMPPAILKKYNGGSLYATTDIATILMRNTEFSDVDRIEYIVDARQKNHFVQVFRVCKLASISPENQQLVHIGFGTMNGQDGKPFKTRSGDTIKLEDIINMLIEKASLKLQKNGNDYDRETALAIGVGAMRFGDLINTVSKDYVFDLEKFLSFEGKTGPYIQYTVVRIKSILNKLNNKDGAEIIINSKEEQDIIKSILKLNSAYEICYKEKSLSALCLATYDLASAFSTFYNNFSVVGEKDISRQNSFISLLKLVKNKLSQALNILAITIPEKM